MDYEHLYHRLHEVVSQSPQRSFEVALEDTALLETLWCAKNTHGLESIDLSTLGFIRTQKALRRAS
jgi:hypothetical protein